MKKSLNLIIVFLLFLLACKKDFVVVNIEKKTLTVNAPANNLSTTSNPVTFWWEPLDGAESYNLQIVRPDFLKIEKLLLDTNITGTKFNWDLSPGSYQWRIKAANAGYSTAFQVFNIKVDTTTNLTEQLVTLVSPVNSAVTGNTVITFSWKALTSAKKYQFQLNEGELKDTTLKTTSVTLTLTAIKNATTSFSWNVKAINDLTESQFRPVSFKVTVDRKGPVAPVLLGPANSVTVSNVSDSLKLQHSADTKFDSIYVSDDSLFITNTTVLYTDEALLKVSEFNLSVSLPGSFYFWRARSFDQFSNPSAYSQRRKFTLR